MIRRRSLRPLLWGAFFLLSPLLLASCSPRPAATRIPETLAATAASVAPTPTAIAPEATATDPGVTAVPPTPTLIAAPARETEAAEPFRMVLATFSMEAGREVLQGVAHGPQGYSLVKDPLLDTVPVHNVDYTPGTHRLLAWEWGSQGAGPGSVAAGALSLVDLKSGQREVIAESGVVEAQWAPGGRAFAYIAATPETYELRWHPEEGAERTLARDVVRTLAIGPAGERVAFTRESGYEVPGPPGLYVVSRDGGAEVQLSPVDRAGLGGSGRAWAPLWSGDGQSILLLANDEDGDRFIWAAGDGSWEYTLTDETLGGAVTAASGEEAPWCVDMHAAFDRTTLVTGAMDCGDPAGLGLPPPTHLARFTLDPQSGTIRDTWLVPLGDPAGQASLVGWAERGKTVLVYSNQNGEIREVAVR